MVLQGFRRFIAAAACIIVGAASFALSFVALRDVSVELQAVPASLGWLVPIVIDGGVICGSAIIWSLSREQRRRPVFPFLFVGALVLVSVVVNASHAGPSPLAKLIASLPPLILLGTLELVASQGRRLSATSDSDVSSAALQTSVATPSASMTVPVAQTTTSTVFQDVAAPSEPAAFVSDSNSVLDTTTLSPAAGITRSTTNPVFSNDDLEVITAQVIDTVERELAASVDTDNIDGVELPSAASWARPEDTYTRNPVNPNGRRKAARVRAEGPVL
jgi:hypothetical protein